MIAELEQPEEDADFRVWPRNWIIVRAFLATASQWRTIVLPSGAVHYQGLDYASVRVGLDMADIALTPEHWAGLRLMERTAAAAMNGVRG